MHKSADDPAVAALLARLDVILCGRKPYPWGAAVHVDRGVIQRLRRGNWPDTEKLVPMCRIERVCLTWLLAGIGNPYVVRTENSDADCAERITDLLLSSDDWQMLLARCQQRDRRTVALCRTCSDTDESGDPYHWIQCEIFGAVDLGRLTAEALSIYWDQIRSARELVLTPDQYRRLATGHMGNYELFLRQDPGGLVDTSPGSEVSRGSLLSYSRSVREQPGTYSVGSESELVARFNSAPPTARAAILTLLRDLTSH